MKKSNAVLMVLILALVVVALVLIFKRKPPQEDFAALEEKSPSATEVEKKASETALPGHTEGAPAPSAEKTGEGSTEVAPAPAPKESTSEPVAAAEKGKEATKPGETKASKGTEEDWLSEGTGTKGSEAHKAGTEAAKTEPKSTGKPAEPSKFGEEPKKPTEETSKPAEELATGTPGEHTVAKGDTLAGLATKYYGNSGKWNSIYEANKDRLDSPYKLHVGQKLRIPGASGTTEKPSAKPAGPGERTYTVKSGDTLASLARQYYGSSAKWPLLLKANEKALGNNPGNLKVGQVIVVPKMEKEPEKPKAKAKAKAVAKDDGGSGPTGAEREPTW